MYRRRAISIAVISAGLLVLIGIYVVHTAFFAGISPGPSLIEELRSGSVTSSNIASLEILEFDPRDGWPFTPADYASLARKRIASSEILDDFVQTLRDHSDEMRSRPDQHPVIHYSGIVRVNLSDGSYCYVCYCLASCDEEYYTYLAANTRESTNPNGARHFQNTPFARFLKQYDPRYRQVK